MAYGVKYRIEYETINRNKRTIDILQDGYIGAITSLEPSDNPLEISFDGNVDDIYEPTVGTGAVISFYATPLTLLDLFTENHQEFMVKIYKGYSGYNLFWQGFVNADIYSEDYSAANTTLISINCNDGMAALDKIPYYNTNNNSYYTGTTAITYILTNIFDKLAIKFTDIYTSNDLRIADYTTNFFLYLELAQENFIDENGNCFSCRKVLDSIAGGLGLVVKFKGTSIYFIDPINLHTPSKGKHYNLSPAIGAAETQSNVGGYIDISGNTLSWYNTGSDLDIISSKDEITVNYDPYNFENSKYTFGESSNWLTTGTFTNKTGYYTNTSITYKGWTNYHNKYNGYAIKKEISDAPEYGLFVGNDAAGATGYYRYNFPLSNITQDGNIALLLKMKVFVNTHSSENIYNEDTETDVHMVKMPVQVKVGNQYYYGGISWKSTSTYIYLDVVEKPYNLYYYLGASHVNDKWNEAELLVPLRQSTEENLISGSVEITIMDDFRNKNSLGYYYVYPLGVAAKVKNLIIKDVEIEIINLNTGDKIGNEGISCYSSKQIQITDKKLEHKITSGTGTYGCSRGAFKTMQQVVSGSNISGLVRSTSGTGGTMYPTHQLILQNLYSQYKQQRFKLTGTLDVKSYLMYIDLNLIKDNKYLSGKAFYIVSGTYNDVNEAMDVEMLELTNTRDNII